MNKQLLKDKIQSQINQCDYLVNQLLKDEKHVMMIKDRFDNGRAIEVCNEIDFLQDLLRDIDNMKESV